MSTVKKKFVTYEEYSDKSLSDIFDPTLLSSATVLHCVELRTCILLNKGSAFELKPLPVTVT